MIFSPNPKKDLAARDFLNKFPPTGEAWLIEETDWDRAAIFGDPGQSYGTYSVKFPALAIGGGGNVYESPEAMHDIGLNTLFRELRGRSSEGTWTIRIHITEKGDKERALIQQTERAHEFEQYMYRQRERNARPTPKYR